MSCEAASGSAWESVQIARNVRRPTARRYLDGIVEGFIELHGDRAFADDGAILAGIGWLSGHPVTVIAQEKGVNLADRVARNFGCPQPEGYRKSLRLMREAEKFGRPILCLVDTQGAFCGTEAEERGQGNAIADNLVAVAGLTEAAEAMRMDAASVLECGIIDAVISEGEGPAHENPEEAVAAVRDYVRDAYKELADLAPDELVRQRQERFAKF